MRKLIHKEKYVFKKGSIIHLDNFYNISAFVMANGRTEPCKQEGLSEKNYDPSMSDTYRVLMDFTIEITVKTT